MQFPATRAAPDRYYKLASIFPWVTSRKGGDPEQFWTDLETVQTWYLALAPSLALHWHITWHNIYLARASRSYLSYQDRGPGVLLLVWTKRNDLFEVDISWSYLAFMFLNPHWVSGFLSLYLAAVQFSGPSILASVLWPFQSGSSFPHFGRCWPEPYPPNRLISDYHQMDGQSGSYTNCLFTKLEESSLVLAGFLTAQFLQKT